METLVAHLTVPAPTTPDEDTREAILTAEGMSRLPPNRAEQAWGGTLPSLICLTARTQDSAMFLTTDWVVTVRSVKLIDCIAGMFTFINVLGQALSIPVGVELSDTHSRTSRTLYNQLDRERTIRRCLNIGLWVIPILAGICTSVAIAWMTRGGQ